MTQPQYELGMIGLGVMGRNLLLNMADHGFSVAGYDISSKQVQALQQDAANHPIEAFDQLKPFVESLKSPRVVMILVPAGAPVDSAIQNLLPLLQKGDTIIDGGNSHFVDTDRRIKALEDKGIHFLGVGVSGGEAGARTGPSIMPGGALEAYERVRPVLEAVSAKVDGEPCVAHMGIGSAGHYVKMVHNGIEYGLMQLLAESYDLLKNAVGLDSAALHQTFQRWNADRLNSFLVEITATIFEQKDASSGKPLIDLIQDVARQKGTGMWTSEDAMNLQVPIPTIDMAVTLRDLSGFKDDRLALSQTLKGPDATVQHFDKTALTESIANALLSAMVLTYAQGMALLQTASQHYHYEMNLAQTAKIWRGGCIIRSALLEPIAKAYETEPALTHLLRAPYFAELLSRHQQDLRQVAQVAAQTGIPAPGFMSALGYYDAFRRAWLPANLLQAQRDYFGAHTYERVDQTGVFHTEWGQTVKEQAHA